MPRARKSGKSIAKGPFQSHNFDSNEGNLDVKLETFGVNPSYLPSSTLMKNTMTSSGFRLWRSRYIEGYCVVAAPSGVTKGHQIASGVSRAASWPQGLLCRMSDDYPKDIQLPDSLFGPSWVIVSSRARAIAEPAARDTVEWLPVGIADHKGRTVAQDYAIVNPLKVVDAIDVAASKPIWNLIQTDLIASCEQLVIDQARVPAELQMFRLRHLEHQVVLRADLAQSLEAAGLVGLALRHPLQFTGS